MRNVFDQYSQPENRVTHALTTALFEDHKLLRAFVKEIADIPLPKGPHSLKIFEQTYPGEIEMDEEEAERRGIPDAWITAGDDWCLVIENKVLITATNEQLTRHLATARRLGYTSPNALVLTVRPPNGEMPQGTQVVEWRTVYRWLIDKASESPWASRVAEFLEVMEGRMVDQQQLTAGTMTAFNGFPFDSGNPFSYLEAKRILGLAMRDLRSCGDLKSELGMAPDLLGRPAITGRSEDVVWDFLQLNAARAAKTFTEFPHLTLGISRTAAEAMVTVPNSVRRQSIRRLVALGPNGFRELVREVLERMAPTLTVCDGMEPRFNAVQRRYPSQRSVPFRDAIINFDLRTCFNDVGPPKTQSQWIDAIYQCLAAKKSNFQIQIGAVFPYQNCEAIKSADALKYVARAWIACRPVIELLIEDEPT